MSAYVVSRRETTIHRSALQDGTAMLADVEKLMWRLRLLVTTQSNVNDYAYVHIRHCVRAKFDD